MIVSYRIQSLILIFSFLACSLQAVAGVPNEFPRTVGTVGAQTNDIATVVFSDAKPSANEFPTTVGTVNKDSGGFEITWDSSSLSNVLSTLDIFGLFTSDDKKDVKTAPEQAASAQTQPILLAQNNNQADTKKSNDTELMEKTVPVATPEQPAKPSNFSKEATPKKTPTKERHDASSLIFSKDKKSASEPTSQLTEHGTNTKVVDVAEVDSIEVIDDHLKVDASKEQTNNTVVAQDDDWRKNRQWWQRGSPVL